jgi:hypothetical protein
VNLLFWLLAGASTSIACRLCQEGTYGTGSGQYYMIERREDVVLSGPGARNEDLFIRLVAYAAVLWVDCLIITSADRILLMNDIN